MGIATLPSVAMWRMSNSLFLLYHLRLNVKGPCNPLQEILKGLKFILRYKRGWFDSLIKGTKTRSRMLYVLRAL